ncbi:hypothetical protein [Curtobacterium oceanosedimentum]|uniref:hypothetical protein n=1 Tax=Curtobacterium oceanosedimentum TaxID=465820 RepID=UPI001CE0F819|nr:hypothetical protein [Curtobacterium oceanosedimentum]MCA5922177.1 hypothetical protein [Curtobacterium oceanosedimentum]
MDESEAPGAISPRGKKRQAFIAPDFDYSDDNPPLRGGRVILISAPAAVGKSWLAAELSARTFNPLWDLSRFSVGSNFFTGTITDVYGASGFSTFTDRLRAGEACLILDAADEALVRVGSNSFQVGLENLAKLLGSNPQMEATTGAVILGRPETIAESKKILSEAGLSVIELRVKFFSEDQARAFVRTKVSSTKFKVVSELDPFLTEFFDNVKSALQTSSWDQSDDFLGYSPVLDALATFYNDAPNPMRLMSDLHKEQSFGHVWTLLIKIINEILDRETDKFADAFGDGDEGKIAYGREVYDRRAQLEYLLTDEPETFLPELPDTENDDWLNDLEEQLRRWFVEHPLRKHKPLSSGANPLDGFANAAFRDFAIASMLGWGDSDAVTRVNDYWRSPTVNPSLMLSRFIFTMYGVEDLLPLAALGLVADSHASAVNLDAEAILRISEEWEGDENEGSVIRASLDRTGRMHSASAWLVFVGEDGEGDLEFHRSLARVVVDSPERRIVLGAGALDFVLGPDALISCAAFVSEAVEVRLAYSPSTVVRVRASRIQGATQRLIVKAQSLIELETSNAGHPWSPHVVRGNPISEVTGRDLTGAGIEVRRLVSWFARASMVAGSLSYPAAAFDVILKKRRVSAEVFRFFEETGVLGRRGESYTLTFSFPTTAILQVDLDSPSYRRLLEEYVVWRRSNRAEVAG